MQAVMADRDHAFGRQKSLQFDDDEEDDDQPARPEKAVFAIRRMKTEMLSKLYRKVNLDQAMGQEWLSYSSIFDWIRLIRRIDDTKL